MTRVDYNKEFFSEINPLSSYWAGFIAADGCLTNKPSCRVVFNLSQEDREHLKSFQYSTSHTGKVYERVEDGASYLYFGSAYKWHEDLRNNFNIFPNKSLTIKPPSIEDRLPFIIGYMDGDGCIGRYLDSKGKNYHTTIKILGTEPMLLWIKDTFDGLTENKKAKVNPATKSIYQYRIQGKRALELIRILHKIPVPKLERKWNQPWLLEML